jgi:hypothetical protein
MDCYKFYSLFESSYIYKMKNKILIFSLLLGLFSFTDSIITKEKHPEIKFKYEILERKNIEYNGDKLFLFPFKNKGNDTLLINSVRGSSGCVYGCWPHEPIPPGRKNVIKVIYDTKRVGSINKKLTVTTNDPLNPNIIIAIKGNILPEKEQN